MWKHQHNHHQPERRLRLHIKSSFMNLLGAQYKEDYSLPINNINTKNIKNRTRWPLLINRPHSTQIAYPLA
ncbi:Uncharacterised protein [Vibrio cholerae]|nr:Uncharacterised protein [Vibrio cholerae]CSD44010.1 Uncharacterised protein [Vibrio cholerae]